MNFVRKNLFTLIVSVLGTGLFASSAIALPISANITNFSVIHHGSDPAGSGDSADWLQFDTGQSIALDLTGNLVTLVGTQSFSLASQNGQVAQLQILGFAMDLNDSDGFLGGTIDYELDGNAGIFEFANQNYGNSLYNSSFYENGNFNLFVWGGDIANDLGLDMGVTATVPEPGVLTLLIAGITGIFFSRRKKA